MVSSPVAATSLAEVISHVVVTNHVPVSSMVRVVISHKVRAATSHVVNMVSSHAAATSLAAVISLAAVTNRVPVSSMARVVISHKVRAATSHVVNMVSSLAEATSLVVVISHVAAISPAVTRVAPRAVSVLKRRSRNHTIPMQNTR